MVLIKYIKQDRDDVLTKCFKAFGYIVMCFGFLVVLLCPLVCESISGLNTLLYAVCFSAYLADILWLRHNLKPRIPEQASFYLDISRRLKKAIDTLK